jgi:hypothetical protein
MDKLFGDQVIPHTLEDSAAAKVAMESFNEKAGLAVHDNQVKGTAQLLSPATCLSARANLAGCPILWSSFIFVETVAAFRFSTPATVLWGCVHNHKYLNVILYHAAACISYGNRISPKPQRQE